MEVNNSIEVKNVKKTFKVYYDKGNSLKEKVLFRNRNHYEEREVLKDISFNVKKGEAIGLIGHNGCGKSTMLKLLTKIIYPNSGSISLKGRVSSLIELGAGFHPDMSGKENIYTNASIFGLSKKEIDNRVEKIIEFSELEEYIDNPVRTYSSGMYMRLAFSVAINVDADILLIDEILGVGDVAFQTKCFNKLQEIKKNGTTIVIVSHSLGQIEQICERSIWINDGKVCLEGIPRDVHFQYLNYMARKDEKKNIEVNELPKQELQEITEYMNADKAMKLNKKRWGNGKAKITQVCLMNEFGNKQNKFVTGDKVLISVKYISSVDIENPVIGVGFWNALGKRFYGSNTQMDNVKDFKLKKSEMGEFIYSIEKIPFLTGEYQLEVAIEDIDTQEQLDYWLEACRFQVTSTTNEIGIVRVDHTWNFEKNEV